jgi:hypothetical protein
MQMPLGVRVGSVLIQEGLLLPKDLNVESDRYSTHWRLVVGLSCAQLEQRLTPAEWNLFYSGMQVRGSALGTVGPKSLRRAIFHALRKVRSQYFNCAEIVTIEKLRFLGIPYITVSAHPHHLQAGGFLQSHDERKRFQKHTDWALA